MVMEDLIACGACSFLGIGLTVAIQNDFLVGDFAIPSGAIRDEGTSSNYLPKYTVPTAGEDLLNGLKSSRARLAARHHMRLILTTDAPYRETPSKVRYFQRHGVLGIDMETSAIFSVDMYYKVRAACLLVVSSNMSARESHDIGLYDEKLDRYIDNAARACVSLIKIGSKAKYI